MRPQSRISAQVRRLRKSESADGAPKKIKGVAPRKKTQAFQASGQSSGQSSGEALAEKLSYAELETLARQRWLNWFANQGWSPFSFQSEAWDAYLAGESGLISVPTGSGKTYAALGGPMLELLSQGAPGLLLIYISPLKALVRDIAQAIERPLRELELPYTVDVRTGDSTNAQRAKMRLQLPTILITTPESLALLLAEKDSAARLGGVRAVVLDEWHELLGSKRGSLLELSLAKLRARAPALRTWALSATLANLSTAAQVAVGTARPFRLIRDQIHRAVAVSTILPKDMTSFPWFGHSGLRLKKELLSRLDPCISTLIFTNTRSQAERWYQQLLIERPAWTSILALHHGSLDRDERERVENGVKNGELRIVVATSSLDLGVDFPQVERAIQIGSTKGFSRALQRAGRAFHRPGKCTELMILPTHLLEIIEVAALRAGLKDGALETRTPLAQPMDVLVQFVLNCAFGDGFTESEILQTIRSAQSFSDTSEAQLTEILNFVVSGGNSLQAYPQFRKLVLNQDHYQFSSPRAARAHRLNMGTIISDGGVLVRFPKGQKLGMVDESFIAKLRAGDIFQFSGRSLQLIQFRDMNAYVRLAPRRNTVAPVWNGTSFPISSDLSFYLRKQISEIAQLDMATLHDPDANVSLEIKAFAPAAMRQREASHLPLESELLIESLAEKKGYHLFIYTFEGRAVHEGLGHLLAFRLSKQKANTISVSANDHGFELFATEPLGKKEDIYLALTTTENLQADIEASLNFTELAKRSFREVARVAGLIQQGIPGQNKSVRQLQVSSSLLFDVFQKYEPDHLLLKQAAREVIQQQLQFKRLERVMKQMQLQRPVFVELNNLTPFSFPLFIENIQSRLSTEKLEERIERIQKQMLLAATAVHS